MPVPNGYREAFLALRAPTASGQVAWKTHEYGFVAQIAGSAIRLWAGTHEDTNVDFVAFGLLDQNGKPLDHWFIDDGDEDYLPMTWLLHDARRTALGVPERLLAIRNALIALDSSPGMEA